MQFQVVFVIMNNNFDTVLSGLYDLAKVVFFVKFTNGFHEKLRLNYNLVYIPHPVKILLCALTTHIQVSFTSKIYPSGVKTAQFLFFNNILNYNKLYG